MTCVVDSRNLPLASCLPGIHCVSSAGLNFAYAIDESGADSVFMVQIVLPVEWLEFV